jgi:hypothetical protein
MKKVLLILVGLVLGVLVSAVLAFFGWFLPRNNNDEFVASVHTLPRPGSYSVEVGDLIELAYETDSETGPTNLKVEVSGKAVIPARPRVVFVPSIPPLPGESIENHHGSEIQAHLIANVVGEATITIIPVSFSGEITKNPKIFQITVRAKGSGINPPN